MCIKYHQFQDSQKVDNDLSDAGQILYATDSFQNLIIGPKLKICIFNSLFF